MTLPFVTLALLMLTAAALVIALPLWRVAGQAAGPQPLSWRWPTVWLVTGLGMMAAGTYGVVGEPAALLIGDRAVKATAAPAALARETEEAQGALSGDAAQAVPGGSPGAQEPQGTVDQARIEGMVQRLAERLKTAPRDPAGWRMLARSYETLGRFDQAVQAYRQLLALQAPDADLLLDYAVALGMSHGQTLAGEPEAAINQALKLQPGHIQALALSGSAAFEQQDYPRAVGQWRKLLAVIPGDAPMRESIEANIGKARKLAAKDRP